MDETNATDHLSSSLTDLMTSLMVIFILLLLVFVSHTASKDASATDMLLRDLLKQLQAQSLREDAVHLDPRDRNAILIVVPNGLMDFDLGNATLKLKGKDFLEGYTPALAQVLCAGPLSKDVDSVVVEGHTDRGQFARDSENKNLILSQNRSMAVVQEMLKDLNTGTSHACFLEKLSATGRGEQDALADDAQSRRVIFRIRVKAAQEPFLERTVQATQR
jgi:flagellar motor protein MotB